MLSNFRESELNAKISKFEIFPFYYDVPPKMYILGLLGENCHAGTIAKPSKLLKFGGKLH